jgi:hypothetical protein
MGIKLSILSFVPPKFKSEIQFFRKVKKKAVIYGFEWAILNVSKEKERAKEKV